MRIWGYLLLIVGALFLLLFVLAEFGGAKLNVVPFGVSVMLIFIGGSLVKSGRGLVQPAPGTTQATGPMQAGQVQAGQFTVEMPASTEIATVIQRQSMRSWRLVLYICAGCLVFFVALGAILALSDKTPGEGNAFLVIFASIGLATAVLILAISWLTSRMPVIRDLRGSTYLRTTGPMRVAPIVGGASLQLADRAFLMNGQGGVRELSGLNQGTVDYSPHGHVILAAWDGGGRCVYRAPGYTVELAKLDGDGTLREPAN